MLLIRGLRIVFPTRSTEVAAVDRVDMELDDREILGVVGESGSGKSSLCLSLLRLLPLPGIVTHGEMMFQGRDLLRLGEDQMRQLRGASIAMVFQNPMSSLNPYLPVGEQIAEVARLHLGFSRARAKGYAVQMLERVGVSSPESRSAQYPHQLSGGMRQRVMIAIAIAGKPRLLIADEPTASLDVTIQAQILNLLRALVHEEGLSMILVSHDLAVVAGVADRVAVMYRGRVVESASAGQIFSQPRHPYTRALIRSIPDPSRKGAPLYQLLDPVVTCEGLNPAGCSFVHRCPEALLHCQELPPPVRAVQPGHLVRCWIDPP